ILARRDRLDDLEAIARLGVHAIDVVVVNLYPFARAAASLDTPFDDLVEEIDIGGPSMVRAAAKNFHHVLVVVHAGDYPRLLDAIDRGPTLAFRFELMQKAFAHTAEYDNTIAATLGSVNVSDGRFSREARRSAANGGTTRSLALEKIRDLRYGENPHQAAT